MMRFCVVSQSTLSSGHGLRVPVEGVSASWRERRLPCQVSPYFSSASVTVLSPTSAFSTSMFTETPSGPSVRISGKSAFSRSVFSATRSAERVSGSLTVGVVIMFSFLTVVRARSPGRPRLASLQGLAEPAGASVSPWPPPRGDALGRHLDERNRVELRDELLALRVWAVLRISSLDERPGARVPCRSSLGRTREARHAVDDLLRGLGRTHPRAPHQRVGRPRPPTPRQAPSCRVRPATSACARVTGSHACLAP